MITQSRRQFITSLAALPVLALPPMFIDSTNISTIVENLDPARTAAITAWADEIEQVIVGLVKLHNFVWQARSKQPEQVSGVDYLSLEQASLDLMDNLCGAMQTLSPDGSSIIETMTGKREVFACFALDISRGSFNRDFWQAEIESISQYDPVGASELQAMLDSHFKVEA